MRAVFRKSCQCRGKASIRPTPHFATKAPDDNDGIAIVDLSFSCPTCGRPWLEGLMVRQEEASKAPGRVLHNSGMVLHPDGEPR